MIKFKKILVYKTIDFALESKYCILLILDYTI